MKRADIKPGVVYAWRKGNDDRFYAPHPIVFLTAPDDKVLWQQMSRKEKMFAPNAHARKPEARTSSYSYTGGDIGYPVATLHHDQPASPEALQALASVTLADFGAAVSPYHTVVLSSGCREVHIKIKFEINLQLGQVKGLYETVRAEYDQRRAEDKAAREQRQTERESAEQLCLLLQDGLRDCGFADANVRTDMPFAGRIQIRLNPESARELVKRVCSLEVAK